MVYGDKSFSSEPSGKKRLSEADDMLKAAVESGDCSRVRAVFDQAFWQNAKLAPQWEHLKIALLRDDKPMMKLLVTWDARAPENAAQLEGIPPEKFSSYARILRGYGLDATVVEEANATLRGGLYSTDAPPLQAPKQPEIGDKMPDGSVFAGLTAGGCQEIYAMPADLDVAMTFNNAASCVQKLNADKALGHDDWQLPSLENLQILQKNQDVGALTGTFNQKKGSFFGLDCPYLYWSSTRDLCRREGTWAVRFSNGNESSVYNDDIFRLSCRPVRLVEVSRP